MNIFEHFNKNNIITNLANYEMFYQISIGKLASLTQTKALNQEIELNYALGSIYELFNELKEIKDEKIIFLEELKKQASMDALQYFVNENLELVKNKTIEVENIVNQINDSLFFNETMNELCKNNIDIQINKWQEIITDELSDAIIQSLKNLES